MIFFGDTVVCVWMVTLYRCPIVSSRTISDRYTERRKGFQRILWWNGMLEISLLVEWYLSEERLSRILILQLFIGRESPMLKSDCRIYNQNTLNVSNRNDSRILLISFSILDAQWFSLICILQNLATNPTLFIFSHQGSGTDNLHLYGGTGRGHQGMGRGCPGHVPGRVCQTHLFARLRLRERGISRLGNHAQQRIGFRNRIVEFQINKTKQSKAVIEC